MVSRRCLLGMAPVVVSTGLAFAGKATGASTDKPALLGGTPVRTEAFPAWPVWDGADESELNAVMRSGKWGRGSGSRVSRFEQEFARMMGAPYCLATSSGTTALLTALNAMGVGPGDEVIVPPYTFIATINVVLTCHALPVFADTDPRTFQIDAASIEPLVNERTAAIIPVHLGGGTYDVDAVHALAKRRGITILEDSCQSHLAEWRGQRTGAFGKAGCFSFQASKNLNSGEGGAVLSRDEELIQRCFAFHNNGRSKTQAGYDFSYHGYGINARLTEFQGGLLVTQMARIEALAKRRDENANYLKSLLREIPGLRPVDTYEGCTRNAYHLFMMRYDAAQFDGLAREAFLKALMAEGIPASSGYERLNQQPFLRSALESRGFKAIYSNERIARWHEQNRTPHNDQVCSDAVWFTQNMLIGSRRDMDQIADAVRKIKSNAASLKKA